METILITLSIALLSIIAPNSPALQQLEQTNEDSVFTRPEQTDLDAQLEKAQVFSKEKNLEEAIKLFEEIEQSDSHFHKWAAISGLVHLYRRDRNIEEAEKVTARVMEAEPQAAGLMHIWNGDMNIQINKYDKAIKEYEKAEADFGDDIVNQMTMGEVALKHAVGASIKVKKPKKAAKYARKMAENYNNEAALARALYYEAIAENNLPIKSLETALELGECSEENPCAISEKKLEKQKDFNKDEFEKLNNFPGFYFKLNEEDKKILDDAKKLKIEDEKKEKSFMEFIIPKAEAQLGYTTCSAENIPAFDGFSHPITGVIRTGNDMFMTWPAAAGGYHPGWDYNNADDHVGGDLYNCGNYPDDAFNTVAAGCVQDATVDDWGSLTITHNYAPYNGSFDGDYVISQYGHADQIFVGTGSVVSFSEEIGSIGGIDDDGNETWACHLHFEIREHDHPDPFEGRYWNTGSQETVGDHYQDPDSFIESHGAFEWLAWIDESAPWWSYWPATGSWTYIDTKGNGNDEDEDDLNYVSTTSSPNPTATATLAFTAQNTGSHELLMFVPWSNASKSDNVPAELTAVNGGNIILSTTLDFYGPEVEGYGTCDRDYNGDGVWDEFDTSKRCDEWISIGNVNLTDGEEYELEIANNTGSDTDIIIIDDFYVLYEGSPVLGRIVAAAFDDDDDECSVPGSGDWNVSSDCIISTDETAPANVYVEDGVTLTISGIGSLDMDLSNYHINIGNDSRVIIEVGGKLD